MWVHCRDEAILETFREFDLEHFNTIVGALPDCVFVPRGIQYQLSPDPGLTYYLLYSGKWVQIFVIFTERPASTKIKNHKELIYKIEFDNVHYVHISIRTITVLMR